MQRTFSVSNGMRDGYDIVERAGEISVRAWGETEADLFAKALMGLSAVLHPNSHGGKKVSARVHVHGDSPSDVMSRFLSAVLFEGDMHDAVFSAMHIIQLTPEELECELIGRSVEEPEESIAACVLRHMNRTDHGWEVEFTALTL